MSEGVKHDLAWAGAALGAVLAATYAHRLGYVNADADLRIFQLVCGLYIVWLGNRIPKAVAPNAVARQVARFGGWSMSLSGLAYIALWVFAPVPVAGILGCVAILAGIATPVGYALRLRAKAKAA